MNNIVEVKDLNIASYLYSLNKVRFEGKRKLHTGEVLFQFSPKEKVEQLIELYWRLKAPYIQPKLLFSSQRDLKDMIFSG